MRVIFRRSPRSPRELCFAAVLSGFVVLFMLYWAWAVFSAQSMAAIPCKNAKAALFCDIGTAIGSWLFGTDSEHMGFVLVLVSLALLFALLGVQAYRQSRSRA